MDWELPVLEGGNGATLERKRLSGTWERTNNLRDIRKKQKRQKKIEIRFSSRILSFSLPTAS